MFFERFHSIDGIHWREAVRRQNNEKHGRAGGRPMPSSWLGVGYALDDTQFYQTHKECFGAFFFQSFSLPGHLLVIKHRWL